MGVVNQCDTLFSKTNVSVFAHQGTTKINLLLNLRKRSIGAFPKNAECTT